MSKAAASVPLQIESWPENVISGQERLDGRSAHRASALTESSASDDRFMLHRSFEEFRQAREDLRCHAAVLTACFDYCQSICRSLWTQVSTAMPQDQHMQSSVTPRSWLLCESRGPDRRGKQTLPAQRLGPAQLVPLQRGVSTPVTAGLGKLCKGFCVLQVRASSQRQKGQLQ